MGVRSSRAAVGAFTLAVLGGCNGGTTIVVPPSNSVSVDFTGVKPSAVAVKVGNQSSWTPLSLNGAVATFSLPQGSAYAVAFQCPALPAFPGSERTSPVVIIEATLEDTNQLKEGCGRPQSLAKVSGTYNVSQVPGAANAQVFADYYAGSAEIPGSTGTYSSLVPVGRTDLALAALSSSSLMLAIHFVRAVSIGTTGTTVNISTTTPSVAVTQNQSFALTGLPAGFTLQTDPEYVTANGTWVGLSLSTPNAYQVIPPSDSAPGDAYVLSVSGSNQNGANRAIYATITSPAGTPPTSIILPAPLSYAGPLPSTPPSFPLPSYSGFTTAGKTLYDVLFLPNTCSVPCNPQFHVLATASFLKTDKAIVVPNLSGVTGFSAAAPLSSGTKASWTFTINSETSPSYDPLAYPPPQSNLPQSAQAASVTGAYTVP